MGTMSVQQLIVLLGSKYGIGVGEIDIKIITGVGGLPLFCYDVHFSSAAGVDELTTKISNSQTMAEKYELLIRSSEVEKCATEFLFSSDERERKLAQEILDEAKSK